MSARKKAREDMKISEKDLVTVGIICTLIGMCIPTFGAFLEKGACVPISTSPVFIGLFLGIIITVLLMYGRDRR